MTMGLPPEINLQDHQVIGWKPWDGGQALALSCPAWELLLEGNRGGGKTEVALVLFSRHCNQGYGLAWRGIIFAKKYKQLDDVVAKAKRLFKKIAPEARFMSSKADYKFVWPDGEELLLRIGSTIEDYWEYHGQEFPFIHFEELTRWPNDEFYEAMKSCCRSPVEGIPLRFMANTNPFGAGHHWVKARFIKLPDGTPIPRNRIIRTTNIIELPTGETLEIKSTRACIHIDLMDNAAIMEHNPEYLAKLNGISNKALRSAWFEGDWDIEVGGFLAGFWEKKKHIIPRLDPLKIPHHWPRWRSMDWGSAKPYSVGWYTMDHDGRVIRYRELYGYGGKPDTGTRESPGEVAKKILAAEEKERRAGIKFNKNPADSAIYANTTGQKADDGKEITVGKLFADAKVRWVPAKKGAGSRISGAQVVLEALKNGTFVVTEDCHHFIRTVPVLEPDPDNWDDVDTDQEDHVWDEFRYSLTSRRTKPTKSKGVSDSTPQPGTLAWLEMLDKIEQPKKSIYRSH